MSRDATPKDGRYEVDEDPRRNACSAAQRRAQTRGVQVEAEKPRMVRVRG